MVRWPAPGVAGVSLRSAVWAGTNWINLLSGCNLPASPYLMQARREVAVDLAANVYVADHINSAIRAGTPVYPLPPIPSLTAMNGATNGFGFSWSAVPGLWYQVQYRTNLVRGDWINLGASMLATNSPMPFVDSASTDSERFYRVVLLP